MTSAVKLRISCAFVNLSFMANLRKDRYLLKNLVAFEVAARCRNFTMAAEELGISRVAVSRQIAELEANLGQPLFVRMHREVALTSAGEAFADSVNPSLARISETLDRFRANAQRSRLSVTVTTAFATYWLMPRLASFSSLYPEVEINLIVSDRYLDLDAEKIDVAIRYTPRPPASRGWMPLFREHIFPVYSPGYAAQTPMENVADLLQERLLYLSGRYRSEGRWNYWFREQGVTPPELRSGIEVNTYMNMLQAAIEGQGVALSGLPLVDRFLADGTLLRMPNVAPYPRLNYYLYSREEAPGCAIFRDWMLTQKDEFLDSHPYLNRE